MMISISYYYPCSYPLIVPITQHNLPRYPYHPMMRVDDPFERFVEPSIFIHYHPMWHHGGYYYPILSIIYPTLFSINISLSRSNMINYHQLSSTISNYPILSNIKYYHYLKFSLPHFSKTPFGVPLGMSFTSAASINGSASILKRDAPSVARQAKTRPLRSGGGCFMGVTL